MKKKLLELRVKILETNLKEEKRIGGKERLLFVYYNTYHGLATAYLSEGDPNIDNYMEISARAIYNYLSQPLNDMENRISFLKGFYQTYLLFDTEAILSSQFETTSPLYDSSIESSIARLLAIGERAEPGFVDKVIFYLGETFLFS